MVLELFLKAANLILVNSVFDEYDPFIVLEICFLIGVVWGLSEAKFCPVPHRIKSLAGSLYVVCSVT
ncbi:hypothetical protein Hanom_Chr02g00129421 [Helianthus anomalus]